MRYFLYRRGDGNEGNFPRFIVRLNDNQSAYAALPALLANDYIVRSRARRHIIANTAIEGEAAYGLQATVYEGPEGETAFDAAWLTAELQPLTPEDCAFWQDRATSLYSLRQVLDPAAYRQFRRLNA